MHHQTRPDEVDAIFEAELAVFAVVLTYRSPLPIARIGAPPAPAGDLGILEPSAFRSVEQAPTQWDGR